ncbi:MAG: AAA family ATPase [Patescibacteria group bacterium]
MNPDEMKKAIDIYYPALVLDSVMGRKSREHVTEGLEITSVALVVLAFVAIGSKGVSLSLPPDVLFLLNLLQNWGPGISGLLMVVISFWIFASMIQAFYNSYRFIAVQNVLPESGLSLQKPAVTFEAASVLYDAFRYDDVTEAFVRSRLGRQAFVRTGVGRDFLNTFFSNRVGHVSASLLSFPKKVDEDSEPIGLGDVARAFLSLDQEFIRALSIRNISPKDLAGASEWVEREELSSLARDRFWSKDALGRAPGIGKQWSYGGAYHLERFAEDVTDSPISYEDLRVRKLEQDQLEAVLARSGEANAILVADEGAGAMDVVSGLAFRISQGVVLPSLEHDRIYLFDTNAFIAAVKNKAAFESELLHILNQAVRAGNIILVIKDFPDFIESAKSLGSDIVSLLDPYLASPVFQVIAMANPGAFHQILEVDSKILHRFEKILVKESDVAQTLKLLEHRALIEESKSDVFFTYQSLVAVAEGARRYFSEGVLSDKSLHLLDELVPAVQSKGKKVVERSDVLAIIEGKTGIKIGTVMEGERDTLLRLEEILHERIVGQDEAIKAISNSMRRSRSDITNPERPTGSFLFLGPTGVGKTETTKALAATFFGKEESIIRLDMSEYQTDDSMTRLIGSFAGGKPGVLSSKLREQPYGVLLLDEFEKTSKDVLNLFLQILDEGFFSDMTGKRVNARNLIIIATSNAGSDLIWKMLEGKSPDQSLNKDVIIDQIISRGIFRPELLNRFDGVILFHPLSVEHLQKIAGLMLKKLQKRLTEKGIELVINDALMKAVMAAGTDPQFGARPMNRAIQEKVEQAIAHKIISGEAKPGSRLELTEAELV